MPTFLQSGKHLSSLSLPDGATLEEERGSSSVCAAPVSPG